MRKEAFTHSHRSENTLSSQQRTKKLGCFAGRETRSLSLSRANLRHFLAHNFTFLQNGQFFSEP
jgi:hypothetical protein